MARLASFAGALALLFASAPAAALEPAENVEVYGYAQLWVTLLEQMETARGLYQHPSGDEATDTTTGFSIHRARLGLRLAAPGVPLRLAVQVKLERSFELLDLSVRWAPRPWFELEVGQFKVPGTFEALTDNRELDFIARSQITTSLADYSLSRSAHTASLLYGSASNLRDLGLALRGAMPLGGLAELRLFGMLGNGLGANLFFGGATNKGYFITNGPQLFAGGRLEAGDRRGIVVLGGHAGRNQHDNIVFNSGRAVYDLSRRAASGDLRLSVPGTGLRAWGLYGQGEISDDFNGDGRPDLRYSGWAASALWDLVPALAALGLTPPYTRAIELGFRFDTYGSEIDESGVEVRRSDYTVGLNYRFEEHLKLQLNYVIRRTEDPSFPDLADDALIANLQGAF